MDDANPVSVHLELWDQDDLSADDELDISDPDHQGPSLDISVNLANCTWEGSGLKGFLNTTASSAGSGDDSAKVYFIVTAPSANCVDSDNDGLLDIWETNGYDADNNGTPDINLAALGANRLRKDLFLELDYLQGAGHTHAPVQAAIQGLVQTFANAPITNLDGTTGIQLHVDVGPLYGVLTTFNVVGTGVNPVTGISVISAEAAESRKPATRSSTSTARPAIPARVSLRCGPRISTAFATTSTATRSSATRPTPALR